MASLTSFIRSNSRKNPANFQPSGAMRFTLLGKKRSCCMSCPISASVSSFSHPYENTFLNPHRHFVAFTACGLCRTHKARTLRRFSLEICAVQSSSRARGRSRKGKPCLRRSTPILKAARRGASPWTLQLAAFKKPSRTRVEKGAAKEVRIQRAVRNGDFLQRRQSLRSGGFRGTPQQTEMRSLSLSGVRKQEVFGRLRNAGPYKTTLSSLEAVSELCNTGLCNSLTTSKPKNSPKNFRASASRQALGTGCTDTT